MAWKGLSSKVFEMRFVLCQQGTGSSGIRQFLIMNYNEMKALNPTLPILIRECNGITPKITLRKEFGNENEFYVDGMTELEIYNQIKNAIQ
mmetsp:Transcript_45585/g.55860  ORF Transcript_45585/g.55860 Transcript_45585/m.55860 type:complete len:91 (+) Transcript_45585:76-348(+)